MSRTTGQNSYVRYTPGWQKHPTRRNAHPDNTPALDREVEFRLNHPIGDVRLRKWSQTNSAGQAK
ncbi:hypothetical protein [Spirosoma telluris]|uniref:hypothetical protein n=1 Tax=Spirosoma telluris TaxID=2183553 RepID=UPI002FC276D7